MACNEESVFLEGISPEWLRGYARRMLRIEERNSAKDPAFDADAMPPWAFLLTGEILRSIGMRLTRPELLTVERMGYMLGQKVVTAEVISRLCLIWDKANDSDRAKLTRLLGGPEGMKMVRSSRDDFRDVNPLKVSMLKSMPKRSLPEQGQFFRGYGAGLLALQSPRNKTRRVTDSRQQMIIFAVLHWSELQRLANKQGWSGVRGFFVKRQELRHESSEDAFVKMLQLAGMKSGLKSGRPRKSGKQSR
ncbi:MAG: hypothetical protein RIR25_1642 [Verrucomicrobiota bacterium]